jgi:hypothetical protein
LEIWKYLFYSTTNKSLYFFLFIIILIPAVQLENALASDLQIDTSNNIPMIQDNKYTNNIIKIQSKDTLSIKKISFDNNRVSLGADQTVTEGTNVTIGGIIAGAIGMPKGSVIYNWKQIEGPKIYLTEEDKQQKVLRFVAPNRPNDTKYVFELSALQKKDNEKINLGKDSINIFIIDSNKIAKGVGQGISAIPPPSSSNNFQNPQ